MRTKIIYCAILALVLVAGCTSELALEPNTSQQDERGQASQRPKAEPQTMKVSKHFVAPRRVADKAGSFSDSSPYRYLGYGYKAGNGIIGHPSNLTYQIFDNEISNDGFLDNNSSIVRVRESQAESYAFSTYNTYLEESKSTLKFSSELSGFNILPFSIGFKDSFEKTFASQIRRDQRQMMGIVNLFYRESNVKLNSTSRNIERISSKYLARDFLDNLYNISIKELIDNYGGGMWSAIILLVAEQQRPIFTTTPILRTRLLNGLSQYYHRRLDGVDKGTTFYLLHDDFGILSPTKV